MFCGCESTLNGQDREQIRRGQDNTDEIDAGQDLDAKHNTTGHHHVRWHGCADNNRTGDTTVLSTDSNHAAR